LTVKVNETEIAIKEVVADPGNNSINIRFDRTFTDQDVIKLNYNSDGIKAADGTVLEDFTDLQASNTIPILLPIPGMVEAESFTKNVGLQLENTTDTGGGQNIGYTNEGDYLDYEIRVSEAGDFNIEVRVACMSDAGKLEFQQLNEAGEILHTATVDIPITGGWQTWKTVSTQITMSAGISTLRVKILDPEFNVNWFKFSNELINGIDIERQGNSLKIFPNPVNNVLNIELPDNFYKKNNTLSIRSIDGAVVKRLKQLNQNELQKVSIHDLTSGLYLVEFAVSGHVLSNKFLKH
jgi:hypothetical protein